MIGLRGSGEGPQGASASDPAQYGSNGAQQWGGELQIVWTGLRQSSRALDSVNLVYPADSVAELTAAAYDPARYLASTAAGASELQAFLPAQERLCPAQRFVLMGFSQGAIAVHNALVSLAASNPSAITLARIATVLLVADPARVPNAHGLNFGTAAATSYGIAPALTYGGTYAGCMPLPYMPCAQGVSINSLGLHDIPAALASVTASVCDDGDVVCASDVTHLYDGYGIAVHVGYVMRSATELANLGGWGASHL